MHKNGYSEGMTISGSLNVIPNLALAADRATFDTPKIFANILPFCATDDMDSAFSLNLEELLV